MTRNRTYTTEFKQEAAMLVLDENYSIKEACQSLGVSESGLRKWVSQLKLERQGVEPKSKAFTEEQKLIQSLRAQVKRLEQEKAILKKASALLIKDELKSTH